MSRDEVPYTVYSLEECINRGVAAFDWKSRWRPTPGGDRGPLKRGAGFSYDGDYYVKSVTHSIRLGEYKQRFTLTREGIGATVPMVLP